MQSFLTKTQRKLIYYPVAKNANSSAKLFFLKHLKIDKITLSLTIIFVEYKFIKDPKYKDLDKNYNLLTFSQAIPHFKKCMLMKNAA